MVSSNLASSLSADTPTSGGDEADFLSFALNLIALDFEKALVAFGAGK